MSTPAIPGYTFDACRGKGSFGAVWEARWNGEIECAVKVLIPGTWHSIYLGWCLDRLRREGERNDFVRVHSYCLTSGPAHVGMALLPEGTLSLEQLSGRLSAREAWVLLDSLAASLAWLHGEGIVHTGLSGRNVFVSGGPSGEPEVLVSDVGQGWLSGAAAGRLHGQAGFIAPEHWREATRLLQEGRAQGRDVYAFGVLAWRFLTGAWPRGGKVFEAILESRAEPLHLQPEAFAEWLEKQPLAPWPAEGSEAEAARRRIVEQCLSLDPGLRFHDMKEVSAALAGCPLPETPVSPAEAQPAIVQESPSLGTPGGALETVTTTDAFTGDKPLIPRRRRFALPLPGLSRRLRESRGEEHPEPARPRAVALVAGAFGLLALAGVTAYAFKERATRRQAESDLRSVRSSLDEVSVRVPRVETEASMARAEARTARAEQAAATLRDSVELISRVLATEPVEDGDLPAWRTAVRAVAAHSTAILENAPPDPAGMEARWQLARLHAALGEETAALPGLEKLLRDLEAAAMAAAGDFPPELIRLTGRVEWLTGSILTSQRRVEDALPHLRKASDSFKLWVERHPEDTESVRSYARNLYLEGRALSERGQLEGARSALMNIESLIGRPEDENLRPDDRFLVADSQIEMGRIDVLEAGPAMAADAAAKENAARLFSSAFARYSDGINLLVVYDKLNPRSVPCRTRLGQGFFELGRLLVRMDDPRNASKAFVQGVGVLTELQKEQPENPSYTTSLAAMYNEAAQLALISMPGAEGAKKALQYQESSVTFLKQLDPGAVPDNSIRLLLAASTVLNGELHQSAGDAPRAFARYTEAIDLTAGLLAESTLSDRERREGRRLSARAWTGAARFHEGAGHRDDSVAALNKAWEDWEASPVEDPSDQKNMAWVREKLDKLKPGP